MHEYNGGENFCVRECYNKYYEIVEKQLNRKYFRVMVAGTPNETVFLKHYDLEIICVRIGKSGFARCTKKCAPSFTTKA